MGQRILASRAQPRPPPLGQPAVGEHPEGSPRPRAGTSYGGSMKTTSCGRAGPRRNLRTSARSHLTLAEPHSAMFCVMTLATAGAGRPGSPPPPRAIVPPDPVRRTRRTGRARACHRGRPTTRARRTAIPARDRRWDGSAPGHLQPAPWGASPAMIRVTSSPRTRPLRTASGSSSRAATCVRSAPDPGRASRRRRPAHHR